MVEGNLASETTLCWLGKILGVGVLWTEKDRGQMGSQISGGVNLDVLAWRQSNPLYRCSVHTIFMMYICGLGDLQSQTMFTNQLKN